jgi:hypothetical protein
MPGKSPRGMGSRALDWPSSGGSRRRGGRFSQRGDACSEQAPHLILLADIQLGQHGLLDAANRGARHLELPAPAGGQLRRQGPADGCLATHHTGLSLKGSSSTYVASWSLADGNEVRLAVVFLAVLAAAAVASLAATRRRFAAIVSLVFSIALVVFALYATSDGGRHVLPAWVLPGSGGEEAPVEPVNVGIGDMLFLGGAVVAVIASVILVAHSLWHGFSGIRGAQLDRATPAGH